MSNFINKTITSGAVIALALSAGAVTTANAAVTRVGGVDRYSTSQKIGDLWPTGSTSAVLTASIGHDVDALTVAPFAKQKNAPIILVNTTSTAAAIVAQFEKYTTVYIANGNKVIPESVVTALTAAGKTVVRLGGANRYETALNIAKAFGAANNIVVANGDDEHLVDSLSIASIAAAKGMPIFLSASTSMDAAELTYAKGLGVTTTYVLGGSTLVSDAVVAGLGTKVRLAGKERYETNAAIVTAFKADTALDLSNIYIGSGEDDNLIDSLTAGPLAGLKKAPIIFAHKDINAAINTLLTGIINTNTNITIFGGTAAVSDAVFTAIQKIQTSIPTVSSVTTSSAITVANGTTQSAIGLPTTVAVTMSDGTTSNRAVTNWTSTNYDGTQAGTYVFTGDVTDTTTKAAINVIVKPVE